jgi:proline iminopeptidase
MKFRVLGIVLSCLAASTHANELNPGEGFISVDDGPVWYKISGKGPGLPLLVLHGGPGGTSCEQSLLEVLGDERPVIRYDQLGTGRSGRPENTDLWQARRFVEALHTLRSDLGLSKFHLLGHSWGGSLAAAYVLEKGTDGIASITLSSPLLSTKLWIEDANYLRRQLPLDVQSTLTEHEEAGTIDSEAYTDASAIFYERHVFGGERTKRPDDCNGVTGNSFIYETMWGPTEFYATGNLLDFDVTDRLHEIDIPVLILAGEFDEARPERMLEFQKLIPGARLEIIKDAAHASLSRKPAEYRMLLETFFNQVERNHE